MAPEFVSERSGDPSTIFDSDSVDASLEASEVAVNGYGGIEPTILELTPTVSGDCISNVTASDRVVDSMG